MTLIVSFSFGIWFIFRENPTRTQRAVWIILVLILLQPLEVIGTYNAKAAKEKVNNGVKEVVK
jgi:hypothetical protein